MSILPFTGGPGKRVPIRNQMHTNCQKDRRAEVLFWFCDDASISMINRQCCCIPKVRPWTTMNGVELLQISTSVVLTSALPLCEEQGIMFLFHLPSLAFLSLLGRTSTVFSHSYSFPSHSTQGGKNIKRGVNGCSDTKHNISLEECTKVLCTR